MTATLLMCLIVEEGSVHPGRVEITVRPGRGEIMVRPGKGGNHSGV